MPLSIFCMNSRFAAAIALATVLVSNGAEAANGATPTGGTDVWTMVGVPTVPTIGLQPTEVTVWHNNVDIAVTGIVMMVLRNNQSQMVEFSTSTLNLSRGMSGAAYNVAYNLPQGTYNATFFAFVPGWVAISNRTSVLFPLPGGR